MLGLIRREANSRYSILSSRPKHLCLKRWKSSPSAWLFPRIFSLLSREQRQRTPTQRGRSLKLPKRSVRSQSSRLTFWKRREQPPIARMGLLISSGKAASRATKGSSASRSRRGQGASKIGRLLFCHSFLGRRPSEPQMRKENIQVQPRSAGERSLSSPSRMEFPSLQLNTCSTNHRRRSTHQFSYLQRGSQRRASLSRSLYHPTIS